MHINLFIFYNHMIHIFIGRHSLYASLMSCLPLSCRLQTNGTSLLTVMSCALDRISSYTVSLLKRHYSIDDVLSRVSFPLRLYQHTLRPHCVLQGRAVKPLPLLSFSNGKGSTALAQCHQHWEGEDRR